jgi:hypothetical protein
MVSWPKKKIEPTECHIGTKVSDRQIDTTIRLYNKPTGKGEEVVLLKIIGYDDDPRELHEIPEVSEFCKRVVNRGMLTILYPSTTFPWSPYPMKKYMGLGAFELWALANGKMDRYFNKEVVSPEDVEQFLEDVATSNALVDKKFGPVN